MENQPHKDWIKFLESLMGRQMGKQRFDMSKKIMYILLAISFLVIVIVVAANVLDIKNPNYVQGYKDGYRASYQAGFNGNFYDAKAGLGKDPFYNDGYIHGYDEGYPNGQVDHKTSQLGGS